MKTVIDLFCGTGGFSWGFYKLGFKVKVAIDIWKVAAKNYELNFPGTEVINNDILELNPSNFEKADLIIGSPPCHEFSVSRNVSPIKYPKLSCIAKFFDFVNEIKPEFFIMENVPNILNYLRFEPYVILNSANYGVPQIRKRVFFGLDKKPPITHSRFFSLDPSLKKWIPINSILDLDDFEGYEILNQRSLKAKANSPYYSIFSPARTIVSFAPKILKNGNYIRDFSLKEMALAQGFPEDFIFDAAKSNCFTMIGNAVPPKLSYYIAKMIKENDVYDVN